MAKRHVLGIDIGGSGIKGALVDLKKGEFATDRLRIPTPAESTPVSYTHLDVYKRQRGRRRPARSDDRAVRSGRSRAVTSSDSMPEFLPPDAAGVRSPAEQVHGAVPEQRLSLIHI